MCTYSTKSTNEVIPERPDFRWSRNSASLQVTKKEKSYSSTATVYLLVDSELFLRNYYQ